MKTCKGCKYAKWDRTKSGRLSPTGGGRCTFELKAPVLPVAFYWVGGFGRPSGGRIERNAELKNHCPTFAPEGS